MQTGPERLRDWIERSKMNQREASKVLGVDPVVLSQWLNRQRTPGLTNAVNIEQVTGVSVESWLLTEVIKDVDAEPVSDEKTSVNS